MTQKAHFVTGGNPPASVEDLQRDLVAFEPDGFCQGASVADSTTARSL
jgi:hypothetical protein